MTADETTTVARRVMNRLDQRDREGLYELFAPTCTFYGFGPQPLDKEGYKQAISAFLDAFPDSRFPVDDWIIEGDKAVARHSLHGTHQGPFQGIPPTGKQVTVAGIVIFRVADGRVVDQWLSFDALGMMQQLGVIPQPEQVAG